MFQKTRARHSCIVSYTQDYCRVFFSNFFRHFWFCLRYSYNYSKAKKNKEKSCSHSTIFCHALSNKGNVIPKKMGLPPDIIVVSRQKNLNYNFVAVKIARRTFHDDMKFIFLLYHTCCSDRRYASGIRFYLYIKFPWPLRSHYSRAEIYIEFRTTLLQVYWLQVYGRSGICKHSPLSSPSRNLWPK